MAYITLDKKNFFYNLDIIAKQTKSIDKIAFVLKDNAYGHGFFEMAQLAKEYGIKKVVVQKYDEAQKIEGMFEYVLVLADVGDVKSNIHYTINDLSSIEKFMPDTKVELKVNTGMNRNGIEMDELEEAFKKIAKYKLKLKAVFMHHGCADEMNGIYEKQCKNFEVVKQKAKELATIYDLDLKFHSCNSAGLFRSKDFSEDMARVGIAAYGCLDMPKEICDVKLKPVLSLYAKKISQRVVKKGGYVGYGATFQSTKDEVVSNYDVGYGDGFLRLCSNSYITPDGIKIAGRISMDNSSFLSDKDEILIFRDANEIAKYAKTIGYEVLTSLKRELKRVVLR